MKFLIFFIFVFSGSYIIAQKLPLTKRSVKEILNENARGRTHSFSRGGLDQIGRKYQEKYLDWYTNNQDSLYFNSDTLLFINHADYTQIENWGCVHGWTFRRKSNLNEFNAISPCYTVSTLWYRYEIVLNNDILEIRILLNGEVSEVFNLIKLERLFLNDDPLEPFYAMTLKRKFPLTN